MRIEPTQAPRPSSAVAVMLAASGNSAELLNPDRLTLSSAALAATPFSYPQQVALVQKLLQELMVGDAIHGLRVRCLPPDTEATLPLPLGETLERQLRGLLRNRQGQTLPCSVLLRFDALLPMASREAGASNFLLETMTPLPQLNGQNLRFDCLIDSRSAWPMQALLLNGLIQFGARLRPVPRRTPAAEPSADDEMPEPAIRETQPDDSLDAGSPPRISGAHWLEARLLRAVTQFFWKRGWFV